MIVLAVLITVPVKPLNSLSPKQSHDAPPGVAKETVSAPLAVALPTQIHAALLLLPVVCTFAVPKLVLRLSVTEGLRPVDSVLKAIISMSPDVTFDVKFLVVPEFVKVE